MILIIIRFPRDFKINILSFCVYRKVIDIYFYQDLFYNDVYIERFSLFFDFVLKEAFYSMSPRPLTSADPPTKNLAEQLYLDLKKKILNLDLKPRTIMKEVDLSQKYDVSRTPAREAIKKLKDESYVCFEPGLGNIVAPFTTRNYSEIYQMREALEVLSVKQATINLSPEDLEALKENIHIQNKLLTSEYEPLKFLYLDREFHLLLAEASQNSFLVNEVGKYYDLFYRYNYYCNFKQRQLFAITEHEKLLKALEARDAYTATQEMKTHMQNINSLILIALSEDETVS